MAKATLGTRPPLGPARRQPTRPASRPVRIAFAVRDRLSELMLIIPLLFVFGGAALALVTLGIDAAVGEQALPEAVHAGEENARTLLSAIAGGLLTVVVLIFWVRILAVQMSASAFSARMLQGFLRDRFQQATMGAVIGVLVYTMAVHHALPELPGEEVPHLSVGLASVLAVATALLILVSVSEGARSSQTGVLIDRISDEVVERVRALHPQRDDAREGSSVARASDAPPESPGYVVAAGSSGYVQRIDEDQILHALPPGATAQLHVRAGDFSTQGTPLARVWTAEQVAGTAPEPGEGLAEDLDDRVRAGVKVGAGPTLEQDISYGIRQLADVAERALAPGTGDTTAAEEAIVRLGVVLRELLLRDLPAPTRHDDEERTLLRPEELSFEDYVAKAFDRIRIAGSGSPDTGRALLQAMAMIYDALLEADCSDRTEALCEQADHVLASSRASGMLPHDLRSLERLAESRGLVSLGRM